jgi:predicted aspartyl protease
VVGAAVPNNNQREPKDDEVKKAYVIQGVKVWNVNTDGKTRKQGARTRSVVSDEPVSSRGKRRVVGDGVAGPSNVGGNGVVQGQPMEGVQLVTDKPARKKRAPPRKLEVDVGETDVWSVLKSTNSGLSLAQLIASDKKVASDIQAGIRYMHGRKRKSVKAVDKGKRPQVYQATVKYVGDTEGVGDSEDDGDSEGDSDVDGEDGDEGDSYLYPSGYSSSDEFSEVESEVEGSLSGYESEDTHYDYAYNVDRLKEASPFMVNVSIGNVEVEAVVDTGAATSVISKKLAKKLGLRVNDDLMTIEQLDGNPSKPNGVCEQVHIRIGGKLRPEHFIVHDNKADLMLLGMTWFEAYGAVPYPQERQLLVPTRSGRDLIIQGRPMNEKEKKVYTVGSIGIYHAKIGSVGERVYDGEDEAYEEKKKEEVQ